MGKKVMWRIFLIITIVFLYSFIKKYVVEDINIEIQKVNDYNEIIQLNGIALITEGENMINENILSTQEKEFVNEIIQNTTKLLKEVQPEKEGD